MRFITKKVHSLIDYPVAISLIALPFLLGQGKANAAALWVSVITGIAAIYYWAGAAAVLAVTFVFNAPIKN